MGEWYSHPGPIGGSVTPTLYKDHVYALTRILILSQAPIRRGGPEAIESKYYHWIALPQGYFEEIFEPMTELLAEVLTQLQRWEEARIDIPQDEHGQQKLDLLHWILEELVVPRQIPARVDRETLEKKALEFSRRAQIDAEDYYDRLGLATELAREYHEEDWEGLVRLTCINLLNMVEKKERLTDAHKWLKDPVLRAHYDHKREQGKITSSQTRPSKKYRDLLKNL